MHMVRNMMLPCVFSHALPTMDSLPPNRGKFVAENGIVTAHRISSIS